MKANARGLNEFSEVDDLGAAKEGFQAVKKWKTLKKS
jgi:hypothetical protein